MMSEVSLVLNVVALAAAGIFAARWAKAKYTAWRTLHPLSLAERVAALEHQAVVKIEAELLTLTPKP
jgi:hypothetical protein